MCVKLSLGNLNPDPCPSNLTSTYTCGVTIALRVCGSTKSLLNKWKMLKLQKINHKILTN